MNHSAAGSGVLTYSDFGKRGRLGNQLFHIAGTYAIARWQERPWRLPAWHYNPYFSCPVDNFSGSTEGAQDVRDFLEGAHPFTSMVLQMPQLWDGLEDGVKAMFAASDLALTLIDADPNRRDLLQGGWTAVHVRRGDFLERADEHPPVTLDYLCDAIGRLDAEKDDLVIFSEDPWWARENLAPLYPDARILGPGPDVIDLLVMSRANRFVCSNSTFSWWSAYLSESRDVAVPQVWNGPARRYHPTAPYNGEYLKLPGWTVV